MKDDSMNFFMFSPQYIPFEQHIVDRLRNGFRPNLKQALIAFQFKTVRELIEVTRAFETCITENQGRNEFEKSKTSDFSSGRPSLLKKGKTGPLFKKKRGESNKSRALVRVFQNTNGGTIQGRTRINPSGGLTGQRTATYL
jgi:hypothetical protein